MKSKFPNIYNLANLKEVTVRQQIGEHEGHEGWDLKLRRNLNDWKMEDVATLLRKLENVHVGLVFEEDKRVWSKTSKGVFLVCSFYNSLGEESPRFTLWKFL